GPSPHSQGQSRVALQDLLGEGEFPEVPEQAWGFPRNLRRGRRGVEGGETAEGKNDEMTRCRLPFGLQLGWPRCSAGRQRASPLTLPRGRAILWRTGRPSSTGWGRSPT